MPCGRNWRGEELHRNIITVVRNNVLRDAAGIDAADGQRPVGIVHAREACAICHNYRSDNSVMSRW